jgi:transcriptional regulator with XRE-family HTH domain
MSFKNRLKKLRQEQELTQDDFAKELNMSRSAIAAYESGRNEPPYEVLRKIADFFQVTTDYLIGKTHIRNVTDEITNSIQDDPELLEFWDELKDREDLQILFKQTKNLDNKGIQQIIRIIKAIEDEEDNE